MPRRYLPGGLALIALTLLPTTALLAQEQPKTAVRFEQPVPAQTDATSARIIDLHLQARGGIDAIKKAKTVMLSGTIREGNMDFRVTHYFQAPNKYRREMRRENLGWNYLTVHATDGQVSWTQELLPEKKPARQLEEAEMRHVMPEHYFYDALVGWEEKGHRFRYIGEAQAAGAPAFILKAELKSGETLYYYFDKEHFLLRNVGFTDDYVGRKIDADRFPTRWERKNGVRLETSYELRNKGELYKTVTFDRVEVNPQLDADLFEMPEFREVWLRQTGRGSSRLEHRPDVPGLESAERDASSAK